MFLNENLLVMKEEREKGEKGMEKRGWREGLENMMALLFVGSYVSTSPTRCSAAVALRKTLLLPCHSCFLTFSTTLDNLRENHHTTA